MRLIDADMLIKQLEWLDVDDFILFNEVKATINTEVPTVKAIPIEWIKRWALDHYPFTAPTLTVEVFKHMEVMRMIEDWKKENETD